MRMFICVSPTELALAAERVPDGPRPVGVGRGTDGPIDEGIVEVGFVAEGIGSPEHGVVRVDDRVIQREDGGPELGNEVGGVLGPGEHGTGGWVVDVFVDSGVQPVGLRNFDELIRLGTGCKNQ